MDVITFLSFHAGLTITILTIFGLVVGSFLNVLIYRLPIMLQRDWRQQCLEYLEKPREKLTPEIFNLFFPPSHCPNCKHRIRPWENIPLLSYVFLRGKCSQCKTVISLRYPLIETLSAVIAIIVYLQLGFTWQCAGALILSWSLIVMSAIDIEHQILPDDITLPLLWLGLIINMFQVFTPLESALIGTIIAYLSLWIINFLFFRITGKVGMGQGDFKLYALFGAWLGYRPLLLIILIAALLGMIVALILMLLKKHKRDQPLPFGPFIALAGWIALLWGNTLISLYLDLALGM